MALRLTKGTPIKISKLKPRADTILPVPQIYQQQSNWCWAACTEMLCRFFGITNWNQCHFAQVLFGADCCGAPSSAVCNQPNWPENAFALVSILYSKHNFACSFWSVRHEISNSRPMVCYYAWTGGGAHVAVIRGFYENGDLDVNDPAYGQGRRTFNSILNAYGLGSWTISYTGIRR